MRPKQAELDLFLSIPGTASEHYKKFSYDELIAISMGMGLARDFGYFKKDAPHNNVDVTVARIECQIAVKTCRGMGLNDVELIEAVLLAIYGLVERRNTKQGKETIPLQDYLNSLFEE